jgi:hypothetical protein
MRIKNRAYVFLLLFCVFSIGVTNGNPLEPIRNDREYWTCYDYSFNYANQNPEWGILTISNNKFFYGSCHNVNYKIDGDKLIIYDDSNHYNYTIKNFQHDTTQYYYFWINEEPLRNWKFLIDNRNVVI